MRALVLHGPNQYRVQDDWPEPDAKPGWARVRVRYAGVCGSDLPRFTMTGSYHHPMVLGHEFCGIVDTPAPGSTTYHGGELVAVLPLIPCRHCPACLEHDYFACVQYQFIGSRNDGGFAEYCLVPEENLFPLPDDLDLRLGALIEPLVVGLHAARRSEILPGQRALVFGAGPIGLLVGMWLQIFGADRVIMADVRAESLDLAQKAGFKWVIDSVKGDLGSLGPFDVCIEAAGARSALLDAIAQTRAKGTITVIGRSTNDTVIPLKQFESLMRKELSLRGCWGYNVRNEEPLVRKIFSQNVQFLEALITHEIGLEQAPDMIRAMAAKKLYYGKVLINMDL